MRALIFAVLLAPCAAFAGSQNSGAPNSTQILSTVSPFYVANAKANGVVGNCIADDTVAIQRVINANASVYFPTGCYWITAPIHLPGNEKITGDGINNSSFTFSGSSVAFNNATPGVRIYDWSISNLSLNTATSLSGTLLLATTGFMMDSVSTSHFDNVVVTGFGAAWDIFSPTSGFSVYNRFYNTNAASCDRGYVMRGTSSNANSFEACRANAFTTDGFEIQDSNENHITSCQIESNTALANGVVLTASGIGLSPDNSIVSSRFEGTMASGVKIGANVAGLSIIAPYWGSTLSASVLDSGKRTMLLEDSFANNGSLKIATANTAQVKLYGALNDHTNGQTATVTFSDSGDNSLNVTTDCNVSGCPTNKIALQPGGTTAATFTNPNNGSGPSAWFANPLSSSTVTAAITGTFTNTTWACLSSTISLNIATSSAVLAEFHGSMSHGTLNATISLGILVNGRLIDGETGTAGLITMKEQVAGDANNMSFTETIDPGFMVAGVNTFCLGGFASAATATIESTLSVAKFRVTMKP